MSGGFAVFAYHYVDIDWQEAAHGRAPAVATGIKRCWPDRLVFTYQGDGDLACIDAMDKAAEMKNAKVFNMIVLGGLLSVCPVVSHSGVEKALYKTLPERHHNLIPLNMEAIKAGAEIMTEQTSR